MLTPGRLLEELSRLGLSVTDRRITDWREKGLLPQMKRKGLGRGHGTMNVWSDDSVIDQAIVCQHFLESYSRTEKAIAKLWLAGFEIQAGLAQALLVREIDRRIECNKRLSARHTDDLDDLFARWSGQIVRKLGRANSGKAHLLKELSVELMTLAYYPDKSFDAWDVIEVADELFGFGLCERRKIELAREIEGFRVGLIPIASIQGQQKLILGATQFELESANHLLHKIRKAVFSIVSKSANPTSNTAWIILSAELTSLIGQVVAAAYIYFRRNAGFSGPGGGIEDIKTALHIFADAHAQTT